MQQDQRSVSTGNPLVTFAVVLCAVALKYGFATDPRWYTLAYIAVPLLVIGLLVFKVK